MNTSQSGKVWVTGATGFIGQSLVDALITQGQEVVPISRNSIDAPLTQGLEWLTLKDLAEFNNPSLLEGVDCILHLAGRAHVQQKDTPDAETAFMRANADATRSLACAAAEAGVRRFVLLSSIGVLGNNSGKHPYTEESPIKPHSAYARSKWAAEQALWDVAEKTALEGLVLRLPLVYGKNPKGNLAALIGALRRGLPLPLGAIHNRRSLIGLDNLVNLLIHCIDAPEAVGETFLVSDREVISTTELLRGLRKVLGSQSLLLPVPPGLIALAARLVGRTKLAEQLLGNLEIDSSYVRTRLKWEPPFTFKQGLASLSLERNDKAF